MVWDGGRSTERASPAGQQAGRGSITDSLISAVLGLILPRRGVIGADHGGNALAGEERHTALRPERALSAGITGALGMKRAGESGGRQRRRRAG